MQKMQKVMNWGIPNRSLHTNEEEDEVDEEEEETDQLLPDEVWLEVFDFLEGKDLTACQLVSRKWYELASRDRRAEEYVAKWKAERERKEAERKQKRKQLRTKRVQKVGGVGICCVFCLGGCLRCVLCTALCPLCWPCAIAGSVKCCAEGVKECMDNFKDDELNLSAKPTWYTESSEEEEDESEDSTHGVTP